MAARAESGEKKAGLYVSGALVQVKTKGDTVKQLRFGDLVTEDVLPESVDLLKELGYVSESNPLDAEKD